MPKKSRGPHLKWRKNRKTWEVITYADGKRTCYSTGTDDRGEAEKILAAYIIERHRPAAARLDPADRLIGDILADYVQERGQFLKSTKTLSNAVAALAPFWAEKPASDVREETCRQYWQYRGTIYKKNRAERKGGGRADPEIKPSAGARELSVLSAAINHDWRAGRLSVPRPVWKPKFDSRKDRWLTRNEAEKLLRAAERGPKDAPYYRAGEYLPLFIMIALYTAARHGAILALKWGQVDLKSGLINFHAEGEERTDKGKALIPMPKTLWKRMKEAKKRGLPDGYVIHENQRPFKSIKVMFGWAAREAGLDGISPHTLRHTAASWMTQEGVAFPVIARYLGHADSRTTERIYAHHASDYLLAASKALDNRAITAAKKGERFKTKKKI